jgi:sialic acid synthase SpsE
MVNVIAEIGWNHMGDMSLASKMIMAASEAGASHVKFQSWSIDKLRPGPWDFDGRRQIYEKAELSIEDHEFLKSECDSKGVTFLSTAFSSDAVTLLGKHLGCHEIKVASTELSNEKLLNSINDVFKGKRAYVSTGAHSLSEVREAMKLLPNVHVVLMHCVSAYPCLPHNANLRRIDKLRKLSGLVGYSGHCDGISDALAAASLFPFAIEKHFTIDNSLPGRDNKFAILPHQLKTLCDFLGQLDALFIENNDDYQECEADARFNYRGRWSNE